MELLEIEKRVGSDVSAGRVGKEWPEKSDEESLQP